MLNPLANEALKLGGVKEFIPCGMIQLSKISTKGQWAGKEVNISLYFYNADELTKCVEWAIANGYTPATSGTVTTHPAIKSTDLVGEAPLCPIHHTPMKPSKKPGSYFCTKRVGEGYCKQTA